MKLWLKIVLITIFIVNLLVSAISTSMLVLSKNKTKIETEASKTELETKKEKYYPPPPWGNKIPTVWEMLDYSFLVKDTKLKEYEDLCVKITKQFKSDKAFIDSFQKDKNLFLAGLEDQRNVVFLSYAGYSDHGLLGPVYEINANFYVRDLVDDKIKQTKRMLSEYCSTYSWFQPDKVCTDEAIDKLFSDILSF